MPTGEGVGKRYSEEERLAFIELAKEIGSANAMRRLGYPASSKTAGEWADRYGVDYSDPETPLMARAKAMKAFYAKQEKMTLLNGVMDAAYRLLETSARHSVDEHGNLLSLAQNAENALATVTQDGEIAEYHPYVLTPNDINRLASAIKTVVQTGELLEGRPTDITEQVDPTDVELRRLIDDFRDRNEEIRQELA